MGRKSKYTPNVVKDIIAAIEKTGLDQDGFKAGGIAKDTFYRWISDYSDFADSVSRAKEKFRYTCPEILRTKALESVARYLHEGHAEVWTTEEVVKDGDGNVKETRFNRRTFKRPTPHWIIDRVLGRKLPLIEAVQILIQNGAATPQQAAIVEECLAEMERRLSQVANLTHVQGQLEAMYSKEPTKRADVVDDG